MKPIIQIILSAATVFAGLCAWIVPQVAASTQFPTAKKVIELNGKFLSNPAGFVFHGTTYMPIYYVMRALQQFGIQSTWTGLTWNLATPHTILIVKQAGGSGKDAIEANGHVVFHVDGIVSEDPSGKVNTTYMPVWYIMQVLTKISVHNQWDGTHWFISGMIPSNHLGTGSSVNGSASRLPNMAVNDADYWNRANDNLYLTASTDRRFSSAGLKPLLETEPGQTLYLMVYSNNSDVSEPPAWFVNSKDVSVTNDTASDWIIGAHHIMTASFTAKQPGIYTVQARVNGLYSVPLVLIIGMNELSGRQVPVLPATSGVQPLPSHLPPVAAEQGSTLRYIPYQPINGWLPVSGTVTGSASTVVVDLESTTGTEEWNYVLPVQNGNFQGMVRVPIQGSVLVSLIPDMWDVLNRTNGTWTADASYTIQIATPPLLERDKALLGSAMMDWNMNSDFSSTASVLVDNSPSKDAAIAAISNYVSEKVRYDYVDYNTNKFIWKNSTIVWQNPIGVCEDIAELTASMLKSVGIPAETLAGTAPPSAQQDDHEWLRAYDGATWIVFDPTWNSTNQNVNGSLSNEYMTDTNSLLLSHVLDPGQSYTWQ